MSQVRKNCVIAGEGDIFIGHRQKSIGQREKIRSRKIDRGKETDLSIYLSIYIYICIYIYRERKKERDRERERRKRER